MKFLNNKTLLAVATLFFTKNIKAQDRVRNDETIQQDTVESVDGNEMIEYLKDVSPEQVSVQCLQNKMCISIEKQFLADKEITTYYDKLELRNVTDKCGNTFINANTDPDWESNTHVELCTTDGFLSCGTRMEMNDTHVSYINQIITRNEENQLPGQLMSPIIREYVIPWHCIYPLEYVVGLETESPNGDDGGYYIPEISPIEYITIQSPLLQKENTYPVFMQLFESENFRTPFTEAPILTNTEKLNVEVKMVGPDDAKIQLVNCWATPYGGQTQGEIDNYKFDIIKDYCITEDASDSIAANIIKNGKSHSSQYTANVFKYNEEVGTDKVYLHCNVRVCFDDNSKCDLSRGFCDNNRRRKRGLAESAEIALDPSITTVHAGPFTLLSDDAYLVNGNEQTLLDRTLELARYEIIESQDTQNKLIFGLPIMFIYCFIAIIIIIVALIFGIILLVIKRKQQTKKAQENNNIKQNSIKVIENSNGQTFVVTTSNNNNKSNIPALPNKTLIHTIPQTIISTLPGGTNSSMKSSIGVPSIDNIGSIKSNNSHHKNEECSRSNADSDRFSRSTHHTTHTNVTHSTNYNDTASAASRSNTVASSMINSLDDSPQASRTPSHASLNSNNTNNDQRPIVAKVRQDSYYRLQGHQNNLINAYSSIKNDLKKHKKESKKTDRS